MVAVVILLACLPAILVSIMAVDRHHRNESRFANWTIIDFCEVGAAWMLGLIFLSGGMSKMMPFPGVIGPVWLEERLAEHGLGMFARFIAWSEAIIGLLLLTKQTRVLGAIALVPMLANILMVTVSMSWRGTPWIITFFLVNNLFLLAFHFQRWRPVVDGSFVGLTENYVHGPKKQLPIALGCMLLVLIGPFVYRVVGPYAAVSIVCGMVALIWLEWKSRFDTSCVESRT